MTILNNTNKFMRISNGMKKFIKFSVFILVLAFALMPVLSSSAGLVPCDGSDCDFNAFMNLINNVIHFIFVYLAVPLCAIMFAYAGILLVTSGGSTEARGKAKTIFTNSALGLIIAAAAFLIIRTLLSILGYDGAWIGL